MVSTDVRALLWKLWAAAAAAPASEPAAAGGASMDSSIAISAAADPCAGRARCGMVVGYVMGRVRRGSLVVGRPSSRTLRDRATRGSSLRRENDTTVSMQQSRLSYCTLDKTRQHSSNLFDTRIRFFLLRHLPY